MKFLHAVRAERRKVHLSKTETLFGFLITVIKVRGLPNHDQLDLSQVGDAKRGKSKRVVAHLHLNEPITT